MTRKAWSVVALLAIACAAPAPRARAVPVPAAASAPGKIELVESWPVETTLDHPDLPDAKDVFPEMIAGSHRTLDLAQFYVSNAPHGGALEPVLEAIEAAADRGVHVRLLAEELFAKKYPESLERLARRKNIEVRRCDSEHLFGGVLHAKYFVVDGEQSYLGSQNFDWRSLEHIQELGVRIHSEPVARGLEDIFETDWALAGGARADTRVRKVSAATFPVTLRFRGQPVEATLVGAPKGWLPDEDLWSLPRLVQRVDAAKRSVRVQVLTYSWLKHGEAFDELDAALRRAMARGVDVRVIVSSWTHLGQPEAEREAQGAVRLPIKVMTIPEASTGRIDFARVVHAKYLAIDGQWSWVGTSNWERDYFTKSRNVGVIVHGAPFAQRLEQFFDDNWNGPYVQPLKSGT